MASNKTSQEPVDGLDLIRQGFEALGFQVSSSNIPWLSERASVHVALSADMSLDIHAKVGDGVPNLVTLTTHNREFYSPGYLNSQRSARSLGDQDSSSAGRGGIGHFQPELPFPDAPKTCFP